MAEKFQYSCPAFRHPCPTPDELKMLANFPVLEKWQMAKLIQGLRPIYKVGKDQITCLDDYETEIKLLIASANNGVLKFPIEPSQVLIWCVENEIPLPEVFASTVRDNMFKLRRPNLPKYTEELVRNSANDYQRDDAKRGPKRKKPDITLRGYEPEISKIAAELYLDYSSKNSKPPAKKILNALIAKITSRTEEDVSRAYSMDKIVTHEQKNKAKRACRAYVQFENERKRDKNALFT